MVAQQARALSRHYTLVLALSALPLLAVILGLFAIQFQAERRNQLAVLERSVAEHGRVLDAAARAADDLRRPHLLADALTVMAEPDGALWLVDGEGRIVATAPGAARPALADVLPSGLAALGPARLLEPGPQARRLADHYVLARPVAATDWTLLSVVPAARVNLQVLPHVAPYGVILAGLLLTLAATQVVLRRLFVRPAIALVDAVAAESRGERWTLPPLPAPWQPWVGTIADAFAANRSLQADLRREAAELRAAKEAAEAAERAARASNERFVAAAESLADGLAVFDADDRLVFHNSRYPAHLMPSLRDILKVGDRFTDRLREALASGPVYHPDMGEDFVQRRLALHRAAISEHEHKLADGRWVRIRESAMPGSGRVLLSSDVTARKEAEQALRASEERYRAVVEAQSEFIVRMRADGRLTFVNDAYCRYMGMSREQLLDPAWDDLGCLEPDERQRFEAHKATLTPDNPTGTIELQARTPDGRLHWEQWTSRAIFDARGQVVEWQSVGRDITARKAAEAALRESEEVFRAIAEGVPLPLTIARLDTGELLFANARAAETFGLETGAGLASVRAIYERPDDRDRLLALVAGDGRVDNLEVELRRADGTPFWALASARTMTFGGRPAMLAVSADISERRRIEQALRDSEARLAGFMDHAPVGMYLKDTAGRYLLANPEMAKVFGLPVAEVLGRSAAEVFGAEEAAMIAGFDREILEGGVPTVHEEFLPGLEAYAWSMVIRFPLREADGRITAIGGFDLDITPRKQAEERLRESEQRFRRFAEAHPVPLAIIRPDGRLIFASPPAARLLGVPREDLAGGDIWRFLADPADAERLAGAIGRDGALSGFEIRLRRGDGSEFWASLAANFMDFEGEPAMVIGISDLTERKRVEAEVERQRETIHQNEKLAALGSLLAGVAHELNNPLSVVVGHANLLRELAPDPKIRERAIKIETAAERCGRIVRTFLAMARAKPQERAPVHLNTVIEAALDIAAYGLRAGDIAVERAFDPDLPPVLASADQLHQVFMNLIVNAQHALHGIAPPRRLRLATAVEDGTVRVEVADNGPGMEPDVAKRVFEPFFTTKPIGVGTGIGLSVCHGIVSAHGGTIGVASRRGEGAVFTVRLPVAAAEESRAAAVRPLPAPPRPGRILVVDDEAEIGRMLAEMLSRDGHEVAVVASGREALDWLDGRTVDLVVSDLLMPDMDGPALYQELTRRRPELAARMLFMTGDTLAAEKAGFLDQTGIPVLEKPLDPREVGRKVQARLAVAEATAA